MWALRFLEETSVTTSPLSKEVSIVHFIFLFSVYDIITICLAKLYKFDDDVYAWRHIQLYVDASDK